jgi:hypothetical protein
MSGDRVRLRRVPQAVLGFVRKANFASCANPPHDGTVIE